MMCYDEPVAVSHAKPSGCEFKCAILNPVDGNNSVLCENSGWESWLIMLSQWF